MIFSVTSTCKETRSKIQGDLLKKKSSIWVTWYCVAHAACMNKYLQHIIRKTNRADPLPQCVEKIQLKKLQALRTYLFLVKKRLDL